MNYLKSSLKKLGFSSEESAIYLTCLEFGTLPVSVISRNIKIGRINCYHYIEKLKEKGFLLEEKRSGVKHFMAENPQILINKQKEKINIAHNILPEMLAIAASTPQKPKIQFFEGETGIKKIFSKMLEIPQSEIISFSNFKTLSHLPDKFLKEHFTERESKKIKTRFITPQSKQADIFHEKYLEFTNKNLIEIFFIHPKECNFSSEISIFSGHIAIFSISEKTTQGVVIENPKIFQTQKAIFDLAWLGATSFVAQ